MRLDQEQQLEDLSEKLADVFLAEADPGNWSGAGETQAEMTKETRGSRNWDMRNANQAGALLARALDLRQRLRIMSGGGEGGGQPDPDPDADIAKFEKQASELLAAVNRGKTKN